MKWLFLAAAALVFTSPAFAVGECVKPKVVVVPSDASDLTLQEYKEVKETGDAYMADAKTYLKCLDKIIYSYAPEDPIVSKAGKAHQDYAAEWAPVWGELNLACVNWEVAHGAQYPGGCQPLNPSES